METQLDQIEDKVDRVGIKVDKVEEKISNIDVTLAKQAKDLEHHIYRTDLAEENLDILKKQLEPIQKHVSLVDATLKVMGAVSSIAMLGLAIYRALF